MKGLILVLFLLTAVSVRGQTLHVERFRFGIILPDTMIISNDLLEFARAVESDHINDYYSLLQEMESQLQSWMSRDSLDRFPMTKGAMQRRLDSAKAKAPEIRNYKYFYKLADYSIFHLKTKMGERSDFDFLVIGSKTLSKSKLKDIIEQFNLDYLLRYTDIIARSRDEMKLTATLHSSNLSILLKENFTAHSKCAGYRMRCLTPFCCMLANITNLSTSRIGQIVAGLQKR